MKIETKYDLSQKIWIPELERPGIIIEIYFDSFGLQYKVRYFNNGEVKTVCFLQAELRAKK